MPRASPKPSQTLQPEDLQESENSEQSHPEQRKETTNMVVTSVLAGVITGGFFLAARRSQAAAMSFGVTAVGVYATQTTPSLLRKCLVAVGVAALHLVLIKKREFS